MNQNTWAFKKPRKLPYLLLDSMGSVRNCGFMTRDALVYKIKEQKEFFPQSKDVQYKQATSRVVKRDPRIENSVKCQEAWIDPDWLEYLDEMEKLAFQPKKRGWSHRHVPWMGSQTTKNAVPRKTALAAQSRALLKPAMDIMNKPKPEKPFIPDYCI